MSTQVATPAAAVPHKTPLLKSRLGSFLAVIPLGVWVINHLWDNLSALEGKEAWESAVTGYPHPFALAFTFVAVTLPLLLHTGWGLLRIFTFRPNLKSYTYYDNFKYLVQRLSGLGLLAFLGAHIWLAFLHPRLIEGHAEPFEDIAQQMHWHTPTLVVYLLGVLGTAYHLANGLQTAAMSWGVVASERSLKRLEPLVILSFLVFLVMGWGTIYALYQAGAAFEPTATH